MTNILVIGDVSKNTHNEATRIAVEHNTNNNGLITHDTDEGSLGDGVYHTTVVDCSSGKIIKLADHFDKVILLDIPNEDWSHSKLLLSSYKIMKELDKNDIDTKYRNNENIKNIMFFDEFLQTNKSFCIYPWISYATGDDGLHKHYQTYTPDNEHLKKFFQWNDLMDSARNIKMKDYIPELDECRNLLSGV